MKLIISLRNMHHNFNFHRLCTHYVLSKLQEAIVVLKIKFTTRQTLNFLLLLQGFLSLWNVQILNYSYVYSGKRNNRIKQTRLSSVKKINIESLDVLKKKMKKIRNNFKQEHIEASKKSGSSILIL